MKKIMIVWAFIAIIMVGGLTYIGLNIKNENKPYLELEKNLEEKAIALVGEKPGILNNGNKLTLDIFKANNYEINTNINGDNCDAYVLVKKNLSIYKYEPYIKCSKYTTKGYK